MRARNYLFQHCDYGSSLVTVDGIRIKNIFSDVQIEGRQSCIREMIQCVNYYSGKQLILVSDVKITVKRKATFWEIIDSILIQRSFL